MTNYLYLQEKWPVSQYCMQYWQITEFDLHDLISFFSPISTPHLQKLNPCSPSPLNDLTKLSGPVEGGCIPHITTTNAGNNKTLTSMLSTNTLTQSRL